MMMGREYRHSWFAQIVVVCATVAFGRLAYQCAVAPSVKGGWPVRAFLVGLTTVMTLAIAWLGLQTVLRYYRVTEEGLLIKKLWTVRLVSWSGITRITCNRWLRYFTIRGRDGVIVSSSSDYFPGLGSLIHEIHTRSRCVLEPALRRAIYGADESESGKN